VLFAYLAFHRKRFNKVLARAIMSGFGPAVREMKSLMDDSRRDLQHQR